MNDMCISVVEMGRRMGISRSAAYNLANQQGFYPAFRIGKRVLIRIAALQKWVDEQSNAAHGI